jgi:four helix bundle protein
MRDHTSLLAWREARLVSIGVIEASRRHWKPFAAAVFSQMQRAALSVQLNIAEGYSFTESPTFTKHLGIAYGSAVETGELLALAVDMGLLPADLAEHLRNHNCQSQRLLLGMLKRRRDRGCSSKTQ